MCLPEDPLRRPEETGDKLLDTIYYLYSTPDRRYFRSEKSQVPRVYHELFRQQGVPLSQENLDIFLHDVGVAAMGVN